MHKQYETERLLLRTLDCSYVDLTADYYLRNKSFLEEWESAKDEAFYTRQFQQEQLRNDLLRMESGDALRLWIFKKGEEHRTIGCIAFNNIVRGAFLSCHLGYKLDHEEANRGYITEAVRKGIDIMFQEYGLHRIEANIMPRNKRSLRVTEKLGFYNEGLACQYLKINGKWEDHVHMVLLNDKV